MDCMLELIPVHTIWKLCESKFANYGHLELQ